MVSRRLSVVFAVIALVTVGVAAATTQDDAGSGGDAGEWNDGLVVMPGTYSGVVHSGGDDFMDSYFVDVPAGHALEVSFAFGDNVQVDLVEPGGGNRDSTAVWENATLGALEAVGIPTGMWRFDIVGGFNANPSSYTFTVTLRPMTHVVETTVDARHLSVIDIEPPQGAYSIVETWRSDSGGGAGEANVVVETGFTEHPDGDVCGAFGPTESYRSDGSVLGGIGVHHGGVGVAVDPLGGSSAPPTAWYGGFSGTSGIRTVSIMANPDPFTATIYAAWNDDAPLTVATPEGAAHFIHAWELDGAGTGVSAAGYGLADDLGADITLAGPSTWAELDARRPDGGDTDPTLTLASDGSTVLSATGTREQGHPAPGAYRLTVDDYDGYHDGHALATLLDIPVEVPWGARECTSADRPWEWHFAPG